MIGAAPNVDEAAQFLAAVAPGVTRHSWQTFDDSKQHRPELARSFQGTLSDAAERLTHLNASGAGVFFAVNEIAADMPRRNETVSSIRMACLDLDGAPLEPVLAGLKAARTEPHAVVESSPGKWHVYLLLIGCAVDQWRGLQQALALMFGGDPAICDPARVMRVPGFDHCKQGRFRSRLVSTGDHPAYGFAELVAALGLVLADPRTEAGDSGAANDVLDPRIAAPDARERIKARAREYLAAREPAIAGQHGSAAAQTAARYCVDLGCTAADTTELMSEEGGYDDRAEPPFGSALPSLVKRAAVTRTGAIGCLAAELEFEPLHLPHMPAANDATRRPVKRGKLRWELLRDIRLSPDVRAVVKRLLDTASLAVLFGDSNSGKSFFALDLGLHVALGWPWRGRRVSPGAVVYVAAEGGHGVRKRVVAFRQHYDLGELNVPFFLVPSAVNLLDPAADTGPLIELVKDAEANCGLPCVLIVIDTLARAMVGGDENSSEAMGAFIANADRIRESIGAAVVLVHHTGKDRSKGARGHSSLRAAVDTEIQIADSVATVTKARDSERAAPMPFRLHVVDLGTDADGDPITSCVVLGDAAAEFTENPDDHEVILRKVGAHIRQGALTSARQLERDRGGIGGLFGVHAHRLREAIQKALFDGTLLQVARGRAQVLALPDESALS